MDVRDAKDFTVAHFKRKYMLKNQPVIIRGDWRAQVLLRALPVSKLLHLCGDKPAHTGDLVLKAMQSAELYRSFSDRLNHTEGLDMEHIMSELSGDGPTLREYFEGGYFTTTVKTAQDPRFPGALKDWSHIADFVWPPSLRYWHVARCHKLFDFVQKVLKTTGVRANAGVLQTITAIPFVRALISGTRQHRQPLNKADYMHLFASPDMGRGSPPHSHPVHDHNLLLVLKGAKRVVTWPPDQKDKLYPVLADRTTPDENGEFVDLYMVNAFDVNLTRQPDLLEVTGGLQGEGREGDLIYIPCGVVHSLESIGSSLALAWNSKETECPL
jgi:hypothetical protein